MDFILANENGFDLALIGDADSLDMEVGEGSKNDFELVIPTSEYNADWHRVGNLLYSNGTEYGGMILGIEVKTSSKTITLSGLTWRGMLAEKIVQPPAGSAYRYVSGNLNAVIRSLIGNQFGSLFVGSGEVVSASVENYQINRYVTLLEAIEDVLKSKGYRLKISANGNIANMHVVLSAVPVNDYSENVEVSQDNKIDFRIKKVARRYTHLIAAGPGELEDRVIVILEMNTAGEVSIVQSIPDGKDIRTYFYDYSSAEDLDSLLYEATKKFYEVNDANSQEVTINNEGDDFELGDILGGRDYITGTHVVESITSKVVKLKDGNVSISYKLGG